MKPLIGITTGEIRNLKEPWSPVTYGQSYTYSNAVIASGGLPVFIPLTKDLPLLGQIYRKLDGLLIAGGNDIHPILYGQEPYKGNAHEYSDVRDRAETELLSMALADGKPIFAICRGMQLLNAHLGGNLYQDIPADLPGASDHNLSSKLKDMFHLAHNLKVEPNSRLAALAKTTALATNTHHHQAIKNLGRGLEATARAEDGIIEAVELPSHKFCIGVQSHPESLVPDQVPAWLKVFKGFAAASAR